MVNQKKLDIYIEQLRKRAETKKEILESRIQDMSAMVPKDQYMGVMVEAYEITDEAKEIMDINYLVDSLNLDRSLPTLELVKELSKLPINGDLSIEMAGDAIDFIISIDKE